MGLAGNEDARALRGYAQLYDRVSDKDIDLEGTSAKRIRIDDSVVGYFEIYYQRSAVDPIVTQVDIITSAE